MANLSTGKPLYCIIRPLDYFRSRILEISPPVYEAVHTFSEIQGSSVAKKLFAALTEVLPVSIVEGFS
jgi:hypothetical protein